MATISKKASRFSRQFLVTMIAVVSTALGVVVALAWNAALQLLFQNLFESQSARVVGLFIYAVVITAVAVVAIISMGKLAARLDAQPVEFKLQEQEKEK
jgi:hypothetical protein